MPGAQPSSGLQFTDRAVADLSEIEAYISQDNPFAAANLVRSIREACFILAEQPLLGRVRPEIAADARSYPVGNYVVYYRPQDRGVVILRIFHGRRDTESLFLP